MATNIFQDQLLSHFNNFVNQLRIIFPSNESFVTLNDLSNNEKMNRVSNFVELFNDDHFDLFIKSKIKVFSHKSEDTQKISESLFGVELALKNLLNNQPDDVKTIIWSSLHIMYMLGELQKPFEQQNQTRLSTLNKILHPDNKSSGSNDKQQSCELPQYDTATRKKLQDLLGVQVNHDTSEMLDDIVGTFESVLTKNTDNPLSSIMNISKTIAEKYADKINKGDIELNKIMDSIGKKVPGMDKMMAGMSKKQNNKPKEKVVIDENFSTANVEVGKVDESQSINIASMLKLADQFGAIPGGKKDDNNSMPGFGKVMDLMQKLEKADSKEKAEQLKNEMDTFLQSELGIDVNNLNNQIDEATQKVKNQENNNN